MITEVIKQDKNIDNGRKYIIINKKSQQVKYA